MKKVWIKKQNPLNLQTKGKMPEITPSEQGFLP
jgi:hypothetical protein